MSNQPKKGDLSAAWKKAVLVMALGAAALGSVVGNSAHAADNGSTPLNGGTAMSQSWTDNPNYQRELSNAQSIRDRTVASFEQRESADKANCHSNATRNANNQMRNMGNKNAGPLGDFSTVIGVISTGAGDLSCVKNAEANAARNIAQADANFMRAKDSLDAKYQRMSQQQHHQSRFVNPTNTGAHAQLDPIAKACQDAAVQAIRTGKPLNETQKEMCKPPTGPRA